MSIDGGPWEHGKTPAARGFKAALDRLDAISGDVEVSQHDVSAHALMLSGTDVDPRELTLYVEALSSAYIAQIAEDEDPSDRRAALYVRGLATTAWLAGRLAPREDAASAGSTLADQLMEHIHGNEHTEPMATCSRCAELRREAVPTIADPGDVTSAGSTLAERHRRARVELYERHKREREAELGADQAGGDGALNFGMPLRVVLELEASRLEQMGAELVRWMPGPLWELFEGAARELRELLEGTQP